MHLPTRLTVRNLQLDLRSTQRGSASELRERMQPSPVAGTQVSRLGFQGAEGPRTLAREGPAVLPENSLGSRALISGSYNTYEQNLWMIQSLRRIRSTESSHEAGKKRPLIPYSATLRLRFASSRFRVSFLFRWK